ncbi:MAG: cation diffusion facilitator family transporter, partial [Erysipelotrichaceae bacterium]
KRIKNYEDIKSAKVREEYGKLTSTIGITINIILFIMKVIVGTIFNSVAMVADAINNLSDAGSSIISFFSFKLSSKPADREHPFGHERYEYIASLIVSLLIFYIGAELVKSSIGKIMNPQAIEFSYIMIIVLLVAMIAKLYMYRYNIKYSKLINSSVMKATAYDSLSDVFATGAVLLSTIISPIINFQLDGYMGLIVAVLVLGTGISIIKDTCNDLLGKAPDEEFNKNLCDKICSYKGILGVHDLMIHSYGPNRTFVSIHAEVSSNEDILVSHDLIDNIERDMLEQWNVHLVIHMDPINVSDPLTNELRNKIINIISDIDTKLNVHDFRMVAGETHSNLIFDILVPFEVELDETELISNISNEVTKLNKNYYCVITIDRG